MENIREMKENDWQEVSAIYLEGMKSNLARFEQKVPSYEQWSEEHLEKMRYVYTENDRVVGFIALMPISNRPVLSGVAEISIYIESNSQSRGIGSKLITYMIEQSESNGIWTLQSSIMRNNEKSINLHKKMGFRTIGFREKLAQDIFGQWRDTVLMERRSPLL